MGLINTNPLRCQGTDDYLVDFEFDTNNVSSPTAATIEPNYGTDLAIARTGVGVFTATFVAGKKPYRVRGFAQFAGNEPNLFAKVDYAQSTGVVTIRTFTNAAGTIALADSTGKRLQVFLFCSKTRMSV
jgi:hypothetical protein